MVSIRDLRTNLRRTLEERPSPLRHTIVRHVRPDPWRPHHEETGTIFIHIPRTAGGSMVEALYDWKERGHTPLYAFAYTRPELFERLFKFTFVRNPWDRMVSAYHRVLSEEKNPATREWGNRNVLRFPDFDTFVKELDKDPALRWTVMSYPHFRVQHEFISVDGELRMDFVGRFETLAEDFEFIAQRVRPGVKLGHQHKSNHADYRTYYSDASAEIAARLYAKDIETFDYTF